MGKFYIAFQTDPALPLETRQARTKITIVAFSQLINSLSQRPLTSAVICTEPTPIIPLSTIDPHTMVTEVHADIWENILSHLRNPIPLHLSNPPRSELRQPHLAEAALVCKGKHCDIYQTTLLIKFQSGIHSHPNSYTPTSSPIPYAA